MASQFVLINDNIIPAGEASVLINDLSIQRGYGIFDFFKLIDGEPIFLDDHLARFYHSASQMRLQVDQKPEELKKLLSALTTKNNLPNSGVRMTLTGGYSADGFNIAKPNLIITQQIFNTNLEASLNGIKLITYSHQRQFPHVKTIDYLMAVWLQKYIADNQAQDVLYQQNNIVSECPRSNFFIITQEEKLVTPANNILKGVIRKQVLSLAAEQYEIEERDIYVDEVYKAKEAFVTSTTKNILPIVAVDGHLLSDGKPGEMTKSLMEELNEIIHQPSNASEPKHS